MRTQKLVFDVGNSAERIDYFIVFNIVINCVARKIAAKSIFGYIRSKHNRNRRMSASLRILFHAKRSIFESIFVILDDNRSEFIIYHFRAITFTKSQCVGNCGSGDVYIGFPQPCYFISDVSAYHIYGRRGHATQFY